MDCEEDPDGHQHHVLRIAAEAEQPAGHRRARAPHHARRALAPK
jgi:hypothetical protein